MTTRTIWSRTECAARAAAKHAALAATAVALLGFPAQAENPPTVEPPPAAPAPAPSPSGDDAGLQARLDELAEARRAALDAERELNEANAALARASRQGTRGERLARLEDRQREAQESFDAARQRVPELVARAREAGLSDAAARRWEHTLYGD